jgi:hypothetical protein
MPYVNRANGLQESWLGLSQLADPNTKAFRLFHDNPCMESQLSMVPNASNGYNQSNTCSMGLELAPPKAKLHLIYLDYLVFNPSVASQLGQSLVLHQCDCVAPPAKCETIWKVDLSNSWA